MADADRFDVWIKGFAPGIDAGPTLIRVLRVDARRASEIQHTAPLAVERGALLADAQEIVDELALIGGQVELRPARAEVRRDGAAATSSPYADPPPKPWRKDLEIASEGDPAASAALDLALRIRERTPSHDASTPSRWPAPWAALPTWARVVSASLAVAAVALGGWLAWRDSPFANDVSSARSRAARDDIVARELLGGAVDADVFLARRYARFFSVDGDRAVALVAAFRREGASRVLAADVLELGSGAVAGTLLVELPASPQARRNLALIVEFFRADGEMIDPMSVEIPEPTQRWLVLGFD